MQCIVGLFLQCSNEFIFVKLVIISVSYDASYWC